MKLSELLKEPKNSSLLLFRKDKDYVIGSILVSVQTNKCIKLIGKPLDRSEDGGFTWNGLYEQLKEYEEYMGCLPVFFFDGKEEIEVSKIRHKKNMSLTIME